MKLDKENRKILFELDKDSRLSYAAIAKSVGLSDYAVRYRISSLVEERLIRKFHAVIDQGRLGFSEFKLFLKLQSADEKSIASLCKYLLGCQSVNWLVRFDGSYDIGLVMTVAQLSEFSALVDGLVERFGALIGKRSFAANVHSQYLPRTYLVGRKRAAARTQYSAASGRPYGLDSINNKIIRLLAEDSRISAAEIARQIEESEEPLGAITRETVLYRIKKLETEKVITGYTTALNHFALNQLYYKLMLHLNHSEAAALAQFHQFCCDEPRITRVVKTLGEWDYELNLEVEDIIQYRKIIAALISCCPGLIRDHWSLVVTDRLVRDS